MERENNKYEDLHKAFSKSSYINNKHHVVVHDICLSHAKKSFCEYLNSKMKNDFAIDKYLDQYTDVICEEVNNIYSNWRHDRTLTTNLVASNIYGRIAFDTNVYVNMKKECYNNYGTKDQEDYVFNDTIRLVIFDYIHDIVCLTYEYLYQLKGE